MNSRATASFADHCVSSRIPAAERTGRGEQFHRRPGDALLHELAVEDVFAVADQRPLHGETEAADQSAECRATRFQFRRSDRTRRRLNRTRTCLLMKRPSVPSRSTDA